MEPPIIADDDPLNFDRYQHAQLLEHKLAISTLAENGSTLKGVIIGGSNGMNFSARLMSDPDNDIYFYNLALSGSRKKLEIYFNFLREISLIVNNENVDVVVFSNLDFFMPKKLIKNDFKEHRLKLFPNVPLIKFLRNITIDARTIFPRDFAYGDLEWDPFPKAYAPNGCQPKQPFNMIPNKLEFIKKSSVNANNTLQKIFPNAEIYFFVPNIYSRNKNVFQEYFDDLKKLFSNLNLNLIIKTPSSDSSSFCQDGFYLSQKGSTEITKYLLEVINNPS